MSTRRAPWQARVSLAPLRARMTTVTGRWTPAFQPLAEQLEDRIQTGTDLGCGLCLMVDGEVVVDIRAGWQDKKQTTPFGDPLLSIYSAGKAVMGALIMRAVSEGQFDYEEPLARYWPEFGAAGKQDITIAQVLSHQAGLAAFTEEVDPAIWLDWDATCEKLAAMDPLWGPGTQNGYHPQTVGYLAGELLRRTTGQSVGEQLRELGLDIYCGMTPDEQSRVGPMVKPPAPPDLGALTELKRAAFLQPWSAPKASRAEWMAADIPASNMHATARALAEIGQTFATGKLTGKPFARDATREAAMMARITSEDLVLPFELSWASGVMRNHGGHFGQSPSAVGHFGFGGSFLMADPDRGLSVAYLPNKMMPILVGGPRTSDLFDEIDRIL